MRANYHRVHFSLENGQHAMTDLVPCFRNYKDWHYLLEVGNILDGLKLINPTKVNGDSKPVLIGQDPQQLELL